MCVCARAHIQVLVHVAFPYVVKFHDGLKTNAFLRAER